MSTLDTVAGMYRVPAVLHGRVIVDGTPGVIVGTEAQYLLVRLEGETVPRACHPTWHVQYLAPDGGVVWERPCVPSGCHVCRKREAA